LSFLVDLIRNPKEKLRWTDYSGYENKRERSRYWGEEFQFSLLSLVGWGSCRRRENLVRPEGKRVEIGYLSIRGWPLVLYGESYAERALAQRRAWGGAAN